MNTTIYTTIYQMNPLLLALCATLFTWGVTVAGAALVFFFKNVNRKILDGMLGFAAGVMIAASFWSLLAPAIAMAEKEVLEKGKGIPWLPALIGFSLGGFFLWGIDRLLPHLHQGLSIDKAEGLKTSWKRSILLVLAITIHNIPEGLAVGVAFGALGSGLNDAPSLGAAIALALGIGIQNFPEGAAVSIPLRREGISCWKSFWIGQFSGMVEPVAGVIGAFAVLIVKPLLPYALSFAAGAMIFVVVEELIPESQQEGNNDIATLGALGGFAIMMLLDVALG
ncbi:MAG: ZIP family metal transporter [Chitinispirillaceae bacterium]|nr:ZIP family metal transporter [Chitinispirillaceae bacterium]